MEWPECPRSKLWKNEWYAAPNRFLSIEHSLLTETHEDSAVGDGKADGRKIDNSYVLEGTFIYKFYRSFEHFDRNLSASRAISHLVFSHYLTRQIWKIEGNILF